MSSPHALKVTLKVLTQVSHLQQTCMTLCFLSLWLVPSDILEIYEAICSQWDPLLQGPSESIWLRKFPKCRFRLHKHQRVSSSVCLFLIRFTIPTQAGNVLHHHIILKLKLPYFPLSRPQITLAFPCFHSYCVLSN